MNSFERHNVSHLSASSLNLWQGNPGLWTLRYLAKVKDDGNAAMWRGTAVEAGMNVWLRTGRSEDAGRATIDTFEANAKGEVSDEIDAERVLLLPMLEQGMKWEKPSALTVTQFRIEHWFDDIPIPVIGFLDFGFDSALDVDLKTTKALPSKPRFDHVRQVALYMTSRSRRGGLLYLTDKKKAFYEISEDDRQRAINDLEVCAWSLYRFLGRVDNANDAVRCLPMNNDDYRWSPKTSVALADILAAG